MPKRIDFSKEQEAEIVRLYVEEMWGIERIGKKFGVSESKIKRFLIIKGVTLYGIRFIKEPNLEEVLKLYRETKSAYKVAEKMGVGQCYILKILHKNNIKIFDTKITLNKDEVINIYINTELSPTKMGEKFNCGRLVIEKILKEAGISRKDKAMYNKEIEMIPCKCGCSELMPKYDKRGRERKFIYGHLKVNKKINLTKEEQAELIKVYKETKSMCKTAKILKLKRYIVLRTLKENNIELFEPKNKKKNLDENKIIELYEETGSTYKIAKEYNCDVKVIYGILNRNNIEIKPMKGREFTEEHKKNIKENHADVSGEKNPIFGKPRPKSIREKISIKVKKRMSIKDENGKSINGSFYKKNHSDESKKLISLNLIGKMALDKNPRWKGGISYEPYPISFNKSFKELIRQRDAFLCLKCGMREEDNLILFGSKLNTHHIDYIKENTFKENCCALCNRCNAEVNSNRESWTKFFQSLLSERYGYKYTEDGKIILEINKEENNES
jgi:hypothetical protein